MKKSLLASGLLFAGAFLLFSYSALASPGNQTGGEREWCKTAGNCSTFTDFRDNKTYNWIRLGNQIWMAENLNFGTRVAGSADQKDATASSSEKYCYGNDEANCDTYGGLYQWHSAMALPFSCNTTFGCTVNSPHRGICPEGWHVPTQAEWTTFDAWVDSDNDGSTNNNEGTSLKSTTGWYNNGNGTDAYGWTGLPGGSRYDGNFYAQGYRGVWWSASESNANYAWYRSLYSDFDDLYEYDNYKYDSGFSVRCVKD